MTPVPLHHLPCVRVCRMFGLLRSTVQMLDGTLNQGFCDIEGNRCTVGPKGFGTVTLIDGNDTGSQEFPMVRV